MALFIYSLKIVFKHPSNLIYKSRNQNAKEVCGRRYCPSM